MTSQKNISLKALSSTQLLLLLAIVILAGAYAAAKTLAAGVSTPYALSSTLSDGSTISGTADWTVAPSPQPKSVEFYIDGVKDAAVDTTSPYIYKGAANSLDTTKLSNGSHTFQETVVYASSSTIATHKVTVSNTAATPPPAATPAATASLTVSPVSITAGSSSTLTWSSANATSCTASNAWTGVKATSGSQTITPTATSTYGLACTGTGGTGSASATVTVTAAPVVKPTTITQTIANNSTLKGTITWIASTTNDANVSAVDFYVDGVFRNTEVDTPYASADPPRDDMGQVNTTQFANGSHVFKATANLKDGTTVSVSSTATVANTVAPAPTPAPTTSLSASPSTIVSGASSNLTWSSANSTSCTASGAWSGSRTVSGSQVAKPTANSSYGLTCTGAGGSSSTSVTIATTAAPGVPDKTAPSTPLNFKVIDTGKNNMAFSWSASTDTGGSGLAGYKISRSNTVIGTTTGLSYNDTTIIPAYTYAYYMVSYDKAGNVSAKSSTICVDSWDFWSNITRHRDWRYCKG